MDKAGRRYHNLRQKAEGRKAGRQKAEGISAMRSVNMHSHAGAWERVTTVPYVRRAVTPGSTKNHSQAMKGGDE